MLAEDLNVAFPLSYWVTEAFASPKTGRKGPFQGVDPKPIAVDAARTSSTRSTPSTRSSPSARSRTRSGRSSPSTTRRVSRQRACRRCRPIAERAHREGGLIELDKHNWPWSMAIVPVAKVDLYELANNHVWRTEFGFRGSANRPPEYMKVERDAKGFTERGWIDYGFQNYYALLNCGFRLRPTAGTASGVHPVPLGFGRVYVHCPDGFSYDAWVRGLDRGQSFVTTGPMLFVEVNGQPPGHTFKQPERRASAYRVHGSIASAAAARPIEIVVNGEGVRTVKPTNRKTTRAATRVQSTKRLRSTARRGSPSAASSSGPPAASASPTAAPFTSRWPANRSARGRRRWSISSAASRSRSRPRGTCCPRRRWRNTASARNL